jgi:feruloyl esterase
MRRIAAVLPFAAAALCTAPAAAAAETCAALVGDQAGQVRVTAATPIAAGKGIDTSAETRGGYKPVTVAAPFCRVQGTVEGTIGFELWLPTTERWNGRLLGAGVGGDAGVFNFADLSRRVGEGFAAVTTDSGHKIGQKRWMMNAKARVDYEHRATHLATQAAKTISARFYARPVERSYFLGCSGGGRQGLKEMENYPADYDGIVAGAPGPYMPLISVRMMWFSLMQKQNPAGALSDADWALYELKATEACDGKDRVKDGIVENPLACAFKPAVLACKPGETTACLSAPKVKMMEAIVAPMRDEGGIPMDRGLLPGVRTRPGPPSPLLAAMWGDAVYNDPNWNEDTFQRTADLNKVNAAMPELRADKTAIGSFIARGGKAIIYQGWADPSVIAGPTVDFYKRLAAAQGEQAKLARSVRLVMVPGMYHCRGGPGVDQFGGSGQVSAPGDASRDILWAVIDWVEKGRAPERLEGTHLTDGKPAFTRALCPFPASARYGGKGEDADARNYRCETDPILAAYR